MSEKQEEKHILKYPIEKIHLIQSYKDDEFLEFFQGISGKYKTEFNEILINFLPNNFRPIISNVIKYHDNTINSYITALKTTDKNYTYRKEISYKGIKTRTGNIWNEFEGIFMLWLYSQEEIYSFVKEKCGEKPPINIVCTPEFIVELCDYSLKEFKIAKETIKNFYKFSPIPEDKELEKDFIEKSIENKVINLLKPQLKKEKELLTEIEDLKSKIQNNSEKIDNPDLDQNSDNENIDQVLLSLNNSEEFDLFKEQSASERLNLLEEIDRLKEQINQKEAEFVEFKEKIELLSKKSNKNQLKTTNLDLACNFYQFQHNLKQEIEPYKNEQSFIDKFRAELAKNNLINRYDFLNPVIWHIAFKTFNSVIIPDSRILNCYIKSLGIELNTINVVVEPSWNNINDWYGEYNYDKELFYPSKTKFPDYYYFLKTNPEIYIGFVNFIDFNKAMPDLYLLPYLKSLFLSGEINVFRNKSYNEDDLSAIKAIKNLKLIYTQSYTNNSFDIPNDFYDYSCKLITAKGTLDIDIERQGEIVTTDKWQEWVNNKPESDPNNEGYKFLYKIIEIYREKNIHINPIICTNIKKYLDYSTDFLEDTQATDIAFSIIFAETLPLNKPLIMKLLIESSNYPNFTEILQIKLDSIEDYKY